MLLELSGIGTLAGVPVPAGMRNNAIATRGSSRWGHSSSTVDANNEEAAGVPESNGGAAGGAGAGNENVVSASEVAIAPSAGGASAAGGAAAATDALPQHQTLPSGVQWPGSNGGRPHAATGSDSAAAADVVRGGASDMDSIDVQPRLADIQQRLQRYATMKAERKQLETRVRAATAQLAEASDGNGGRAEAGHDGGAKPGHTATEAAAIELARLVGLQGSVSAAFAESRAAAVAAQHELKQMLAEQELLASSAAPP